MKQYLIFRVGDARFGVDVMSVAEVMREILPDPVPDMPPYIDGVISIRGELIAMLDMRKRFQINPATQRERTLIVRSEGEKVALRVDEVMGIVNINENLTRRPPTMFRGLKQKYMEGLIGRHDDTLIIMNMDSILTSQEKIQLKNAKRAMKATT